MKRLLCAIAIGFLLFPFPAPAADLREIELTDGSVIAGEVLSLSNGVYTVRTGSLGTITIEAAKIRTIRAASSGPGPSASGAAGDVKALQDRMLNDAEIMGMISSLKDDPEFTRIIQDPEIMKAVNEGNIAALMANPAFLNLLNNHTVRDISGTMTR